MLLARGTADKQFRAGLLLCETLGELDQHPSIGGIPDFPEGNDEPQSFDNIQIDFIVAKQLQQLVPGMIRIVDIQRKHSGTRKKWRVLKNGLDELAGMISAATERARQLNMYRGLYSIEGARGSIQGLDRWLLAQRE